MHLTVLPVTLAGVRPLALMDLVRYRFFDSVTTYLPAVDEYYLQCGDVKLRLVPLACLNGGRFQMYALPPVAVSGVLDRLRAPVTVTGRRVARWTFMFEP